MPEDLKPDERPAQAESPAAPKPPAISRASWTTPRQLFASRSRSYSSGSFTSTSRPLS